MDTILTIPQMILIALSLISTGFLGLLLFIIGQALNSLRSVQAVQTQILINISAMQEQIKTLFSASEQQNDDIQNIESFLHNRRRDKSHS